VRRRGGQRGPVALRPRLSPGVPLSWDARVELRAGTGAVKHQQGNSWTGAQLNCGRCLSGQYRNSRCAAHTWRRLGLPVRSGGPVHCRPASLGQKSEREPNAHPQRAGSGSPRKTHQDSSKHTEHEPGRTGKKNAEQRPEVGLRPDHQRSYEAHRPADTPHEPPSFPAGADRCPTRWVMGTEGIPPAQSADGG
jgi:hypothetical protein